MSRTIPGNEHLKFSQPPRWAALFEITIENETWHFTPSRSAVVADGVTYTPFPVVLQDIKSSGDGKIEPCTLIVSNVRGTLKEAVKNSRCDGFPVVFRVWSLTDEQIVFEEPLEIIAVRSITDEQIVFELGSVNLYMIELLQDKFIDFCQHIYKGKACWIPKSDGTVVQPSWFSAGSPDTCDYSHRDCARHGNTLRRRAFPGIPQGGSI